MIETNKRYSWDPEKRGLDFVLLADFIFSDPKLSIIQYNRQNYGEGRHLAFAMIENERFCLCFTARDGKMHLITIFKQHDNKQ
jgi:uncharacterized DUF497 family protein